MKSIYFLKFTLIVLANLIFINCASGPVGGIIYTKVDYPGMFNETNSVFPEKYSEGCETSYLGLYNSGDAGAGSIAMKAGIDRIAIIDYYIESILIIAYRKHCTIVYGEVFKEPKPETEVQSEKKENESSELETDEDEEPGEQL
ncbi:MAG: TRL-like family protein [Leptospiraceae bacterium]|nr:TRL-like family protein [Leptospiraceae bacterium]